MNALPIGAPVIGPGIGLIPNASPAEFFARVFQPLLAGRWTRADSAPLDKPTGADQVRAALAALDRALTSLGERTGTREDTARAWLVGHFDRLSSALEAFEGIGADLDGPTAEAFVERITRQRDRLREAERAHRNATGADVLAALQNIEIVKADGRALDRELEALRVAVKLPAIPNVAAIDQAREQSALLDRLARAAKRDPKSAPIVLHSALDQGRDATADVARLWIVFEGAAASEFFAHRWARFEAR